MTIWYALYVVLAVIATYAFLLAAMNFEHSMQRVKSLSLVFIISGAAAWGLYIMDKRSVKSR